MKPLIPLLLLTLIAAAAGGGAVYVLGPEQVEIVIPENVIIWRQGYIPILVDNELTWIPENGALILLNKSGWENIELIWSENHPQTENITIIWPKNSENYIKAEDIVLIWPENLPYENIRIVWD